MKKPLLVLALLVLTAPAPAEVFKCVVNGKTVFKSAASPPEGCESHDVKAIPYNPEEAKRQEDYNRQLDANDQAYQAEMQRRREVAEHNFELRMKARAVEEQTRARAAQERQAEAMERAARRPVVVLPY
jgi:hypothetical protein